MRYKICLARKNYKFNYVFMFRIAEFYNKGTYFNCKLWSGIPSKYIKKSTHEFCFKLYRKLYIMYTYTNFTHKLYSEYL